MSSSKFDRGLASNHPTTIDKPLDANIDSTLDEWGNNSTTEGGTSHQTIKPPFRIRDTRNLASSNSTLPLLCTQKGTTFSEDLVACCVALVPP